MAMRQYGEILKIDVILSMFVSRIVYYVGKAKEKEERKKLTSEIVYYILKASITFFVTKKRTMEV